MVVNFINAYTTKALKSVIYPVTSTDWQNYAEHMLQTLQQRENLHNQSPTSDYITRPDFRPLTKFEQRGQRLGHGVWDLYFIYQ